MPGMTFSFDDIQEMADERSDIRPWGYEEYLRDENGRRKRAQVRQR
jgi:hypothetical protein